MCSSDLAIRAVRLITAKMADAVIEGKQGESMAEAAETEGDDTQEENADAE